MTMPLVILAVLAVIGGLVGIPEALGGKHMLEGFLKPVFEDSSFRMVHSMSHENEYMLMGIAVLVMLGSLYYAYQVYVKNKTLPAEESEDLKPLHLLVYKKYWVDEFYENLITKPLNFFSDVLHKLFDNQIVDGFVNGIGRFITWLSGILRYAQTGNMGFYVFAMVIGIVLILFTRIF